MAVSMLDNIGYKGQKPDNARSQFDTIDEMVAYSENYLPPIYVTLCSETGKQYMYQRSNAVDADLGKWREITGSGSVDTYTKSEIDAKVKVNTDNIGDMTTLVVSSWTDLVSAVNALYNSFMTSITYADKKLTITYRNGGTVDIDMSAIITDTKIEEFKNVQIDSVVDGQALVYDSTTENWKNSTIDLANVLSLAKTYTDEEIAKSENTSAVGCDEKPSYADGTVTYIQNGESKTTEDINTWFYYTSGTGVAQTRWVNGIEFTIDVGSINMSEYVNKTSDIENTFSESPADMTKIPNLNYLDGLRTVVLTAIGKKVSKTDIVDNLTSESTDKPLSANQGKELKTLIDGKLAIAQSADDAGKIVKVGTDGNLELAENGGGTAESVTYTNAEHTAWTTVKKALDGIINKVYYVKPSITSFVANPATTVYEVGQKVSSIAFTWATNKDITTQTLTDCTLADATVRTATYDTEISSNKIFTLSVGDGENTDSKTFSVAFRNKIYYGGATIPTDYDSAFILGLAKSQFGTTKAGSFAMTVGSGEYGFLAFPQSFGSLSSVKIGGFDVDVTACGNISFTNASGGVVTYSVYRTGRSGLGSITMVVS